MKQYASSTIKKLRDSGDIRTGAEVGVWRGGLSAILLDRFPHLTLYMVDRWHTWAEDTAFYRTSKQGKKTAVEYEQARQAALAATAFANERAVPIQSSSFDAAKVVPLGLDFTFLDAGHTYEEVSEDIRLWWPHVKSGGVFLGHDYNSRREQSRSKMWGVKKAVDEFSEREGLEVGTDSGRIWWVDKP